MNKLKPCPFCGREPIIKVSKDNRFYGMCGKCEVKTHKFLNKYDAIEFWNKRYSKAEESRGARSD